LKRVRSFLKVWWYEILVLVLSGVFLAYLGS
jgi:hypothetical protein